MQVPVEARGSPLRDILSLGAMGQGPDTFPGLCAVRRVRFLVDSFELRRVIKVFVDVRGLGKKIIYVFAIWVRRSCMCCYSGEVFICIYTHIHTYISFFQRLKLYSEAPYIKCSE